MIFDNIERAEKYYSINPGLKKAFEHIKECVRDNTPPSRYEKDGMKVLVQEYDTIVRDDNDYECHHDFVDIQFIEKGIEEIHAADCTHTTTTREYNPEIDCEVVAGPEKHLTLFLRDGEFVCFFPGETHKPSIAVDRKPSWTRKIVVKVKL